MSPEKACGRSEARSLGPGFELADDAEARRGCAGRPSGHQEEGDRPLVAAKCHAAAADLPGRGAMPLAPTIPRLPVLLPECDQTPAGAASAPVHIHHVDRPGETLQGRAPEIGRPVRLADRCDPRDDVADAAAGGDPGGIEDA